MTDHIYKIVEIVGTSENGVEAAIQAAVTRASKSLRNLRWFEVDQVRGEIRGDQITHYQVSLRVGFTLDE